MADGKYGRLFTEDDVLAIVAGVLLADVTKDDVSPEGAKALIADITEGLDRIGRFAFDADEPLFLLRGQDKAAPRAIGSIIEPARWSGRAPREREGKCYVAMCRIVESHPEHLSASAAAAQAMADWQAEHPERIKAPD